MEWSETTAWIEVKVKGQVLCPAVSGRLIRLRDIVLFFADLWVASARSSDRKHVARFFSLR